MLVLLVWELGRLEAGDKGTTSAGVGHQSRPQDPSPPTGCNKLTDQTLIYLRRIANVTLIDLRGCKQITRKACEHFISDLSINSLYCLSDEKLIQKIS